MNNKNLVLSLILIIVPLILLILWYRNYVYNYCQNDMKCLKERLIFNLDYMNDKLQKESFNIQNKINEEELKEKELKINIENEKKLEKNKEEIIEGFFSGFGSWFSGSSPSTLNPNPGTLPNESLSILEKKLNTSTIKPNNFSSNNTSDNDFKDADNTELLNFVTNNKLNTKSNNESIKPNTKPNNESIKPNIKPNDENIKNNGAIFSKNNYDKKIPINDKPLDEKVSKEKIKLEPDKKSLLGTCQFFNDKCPDNYHPLGNFSIQGISSNSILTCGNVQNTKPARAIAEIKNNSIYEIHITDQGHGFNPSSKPKVSIEGGKGHGATAEAVIDDDGFLKLIKVINPGYNYSETPNVIIDAPFMNSSCHLCCKNE